MLINCPRCGFQQPKDQYCAQCGVDMENFQPTRPSTVRSIFKNPLFHVAVAVVAIGTVATLVFKKNQQGFDSSIETTNSASQKPLPQAQPSKAEIAPIVAKDEDALSEPSPEAAHTAETSEESSSAPTENDSSAALAANPTATTATTAESPQAKSVAQAPAPHLIVTYAEVGTPTLNALMNESRNTGQFMSLVEYSAGILPNVQKILKSPDVTILRKEERSLENNRSFSWFLGIKDSSEPSHEIGLTTFFELGGIEQGFLRGNLEILRSWREPGFGNEPQKKAFPAMLEITTENGFFMAGVLPARSLLPNETELTSIDVYKILNSPRFKADQSELVIFIQYSKAP